ncbi:hypothetical protein TBR22_A08810 [Luteitalea sp. TBR-22]|uniref:adenylate/guanylate cyclase domain-containing protein n=1 Tax=Luteitalea sp. TBR-22 TaxID=2802971 RepID=UPI001AFB3E8D|nr:adenylate/guanylate cyclase domain-containing protein [Luteitalea sp. TBR-22]BCS31678.1 hypothetical protein TBR22_A08810 [Luteitalea sp. TBR-22]
MTISFRGRLLAALVGSVGLLGLASFLVVGHQTQRQVDRVAAHTADRTRRALAEVERLRRAELTRVARRLTSSIRIAAALDAVVSGGDRREFVEQVQYELALAELREGLVQFSDAQGTPVLTLLDSAPVDADRSRPAPVSGDAAGAYRIVAGRLFMVITEALTLFDSQVGSLTLGFAVDDEVATRLAAIVEADVCFAAGRCLAASPGAKDAALAMALVSAAKVEVPTFLTHGGRRLAIVATPLAGSGPAVAVSAVPLDEVIGPFDRIRRVGLVAAAGALLLAVLLGAVLSAQLTQPIRTLVAATTRVRRGEYDFQVTVPHADEFGTLAGAFNQMTEGLLLKERYRSVLDKVVSPDVAAELLKGDLQLGGETREVSTLFADVRGFSSLTEHLPPQDVIAMLNEWLELAARTITDEGGVVDKYVGDMVMGVFGAPVADAQHALHAVRAALRLRDVTRTFDQARRARGDTPFAIGVGVNSGPAVAGNMGSSTRLNYTVLGASVNAANRLCSEAGAGEVLIGDRTHALVAPHVVARALEPRPIKGFSTPVTPYLVHGLAGDAEVRA